jgi:hypothetical protein
MQVQHPSLEVQLGSCALLLLLLLLLHQQVVAVVGQVAPRLHPEDLLLPAAEVWRHPLLLLLLLLLR